MMWLRREENGNGLGARGRLGILFDGSVLRWKWASAWHHLHHSTHGAEVQETSGNLLLSPPYRITVVMEVSP